MARSGTTLIEQILASHSKVHGAGEVEDFGNAVSNFAQSKGSRDGILELLPGPRDRAAGDAGPRGRR